MNIYNWGVAQWIVILVAACNFLAWFFGPFLFEISGSIEGSILPSISTVILFFVLFFIGFWK